MSLNVQDIKKLREETGAGILDVKKSLTDANGDFDKAKQIIMEKGLAKADKKAEREASDGLVYAYIHGVGQVGSMVHVACETDFVAKTEGFKELCHKLAVQVCTGDYETLEEILADNYIRDESKTIKDVIRETIAVLGENIELRDFKKMSVR